MSTGSEDPVNAIYHQVWKHEGFEKTAKILFGLVRKAVQLSPTRARHLFLDIEGHRNRQGGWDRDMMDLHHFIAEILAPFLTEFSTPLGHFKNENVQRNDFPEGELEIKDE